MPHTAQHVPVLGWAVQLHGGAEITPRVLEFQQLQRTSALGFSEAQKPVLGCCVPPEFLYHMNPKGLPGFS